jgi:hypothetical protein
MEMRVNGPREIDYSKSRVFMPKRVRDVFSQNWESGANLSFFLALLCLMVLVLPSMGFAKSDENLYSDIAASVTLICGAAIAWSNRLLFWATSVVVACSLVLKWAPRLFGGHAFGTWPDLLELGAIAMIIFALLSQIFAVGPVTAMRIQGAIAAYVGFGFLWAHAFAITAQNSPGSFSSSQGAGPSTASDWFYFSFVTLTTVGYGDIVPRSPSARALAIAEVLTGQLYLAVLLAHLVSMRVSGEPGGGNSKPE